MDTNESAHLPKVTITLLKIPDFSSQSNASPSCKLSARTSAFLAVSVCSLAPLITRRRRILCFWPLTAPDAKTLRAWRAW